MGESATQSDSACLDFSIHPSVLTCQYPLLPSTPTAYLKGTSHA